MARWMDLSEAKQVLGKTVNLNWTQWLILSVLLAIPLTIIVSNLFGLRYYAQANHSELSTNGQLLSELSEQNQQMNEELKTRAAIIAKQKKAINSLESSNQVLSSSLTATEAELAEKQSKKKNHDDNWCWWCD